ncbi:MAG: hypothetical protein ABIK81_04765, partial [candidate division WOR-3 bacterium]
MKRNFIIFVLVILSFLYANESLNVRTVATWPYVRQYWTDPIPAISDSFMVVGLSGGFWILNIANPSQPQKTSECLHWGLLQNMEKKGNLLYVADRSKGFRIFDISALPEIKEITQISDRPYWQIRIKDSFAFLIQERRIGVPGYYDTMEIFNISNPRNPRRVGKIGLGQENPLSNIWVEGNRAYLTLEQECLKIFDISEPESPVFLGEWRKEGSYPTSVFVKDTVAYLGFDFKDTLFTLNVKNPQNIREISRIRVGQNDDPRYDPGTIKNFVLAESLLFLAITENESGCVVLNVKNPAHQEIISRVGEEAYQVGLFGNLLILRNGRGIYLYDATNPRSINFLSSFGLVGIPNALKVLNDSLVNLDATSTGQIILDISKRPLVNLRGKYPPGGSPFSGGHTISAVRDTLLYTGFLQRRFYILNFANPDSIILVGSCSLGVQYPWEFGMRTCALKDTFAFVAGQMSIYAVNISDPSNPRQVSRLLMPGTEFDIYKIFLQDSVIYAACGQAGLWIFDFSNPERPFFRGGRAPSRNHSHDIFVKDTLAFLADGFAGLRIFNVKNPDGIREVVTIPNPSYQALGIWVERNLAFVGWGRNGLRIFD